MESNRANRSVSSRQDDEDSIVDRLLAMPLPASENHAGVTAWQNGIARRVEKVLAEKMRARIEDQAERRA